MSKKIIIDPDENQLNGLMKRLKSNSGWKYIVSQLTTELKTLEEIILTKKYNGETITEVECDAFRSSLIAYRKVINMPDEFITSTEGEEEDDEDVYD